VAQYIPIGEPAHDSERQAIRFLVDGLPSSYTVYSNAWLVERSGVVYELDAVVVAPHAIYVVEIKSFRGRIEGTDHDWYIPHPIPSPLKKNRICAQVLKSLLKRESYQAGQVWVQGLVYLSASTDCGVRGPASNDRLYTRKRILAAIQDEQLIQRLSGRVAIANTAAAEQELLRLLTGAQKGPRPVRRVREYEILDALAHHETFTELLGRNTLSEVERVLRIYSLPPLATDAQRQRITDRARWEAQVLGRLGRSEGILSADPPFSDEAGIVLPLEHFLGITLTTWLERYGPAAKGNEKADLMARTELWLRIAETLDEAHRQGVVHRLLRSDVILVEDSPKPSAIRVTGFDLAKQLSIDATVSLTSIADERLCFAAPEVVTAFSSAEPASDQFSLGAILALLLTGKALFDNTRQLMAQRRLLMRVRDLAPRIPLSLDEAVCRMLELRPADRYPQLADAMEAVRLGRDPSPRSLFPAMVDPRAALDPDNLDPGVRLGSDYEVISRLGQGGMSVVYAARHLVSGHTRALKIARNNDAAEEALRSEYQVLSTLDHPNIVRVIDLSKMVEGRFTLVMERVTGSTLRQFLASHPQPEPQTQRRFAEDLLAGLDYLEQKGLTHKDLKPDNLLAGEGQLTIIDFSLVSIPSEAPYGGTALYRDPSSACWSHATDRFAASLCLFELYAGRHAFDGRVPEPGQVPSISEEDIDPPGLAAFFRKALSPVPEQRFPSAKAMRDALLIAIGKAPSESAAGSASDAVDATTPLRLSGLSRRAVTVLSREGIATVGELLTLSPAQIRGLHAIGNKTAADLIAMQEELRARGIEATTLGRARLEAPLVPALCDSPEPVERLGLQSSVIAALVEYGLPTLGAVASLTRQELLAIPGIGRKRLSEVVEALHRFRAPSSAPSSPAHTLDQCWELASAPLSDRQRCVVERVIGITGEPALQTELARELNTSQSQVSIDCAKGIERLDRNALAELSNALEALLDGFRGIIRLDELAHRFEEEWPAGMVSGAGVLRLLIKLSAGRAQLVEVDGVEEPIVARPSFDKETLNAFSAELTRLASQWPPVEPETARRSLGMLLPHFDGDPLSLGVRLCGDVELAETGHLFIGPLDPKQSIGFVLEQAREQLSLAELQQRVRRIFGEGTPYPDPDHLMAILRELDCRVQGETVSPGRSASIVATTPLPPDALPELLGNARSPEAVVRDLLKDAARSRGFRMLVTPPERHAEIARSVATVLGGTWLSFDDAFFTEHAAELASLERAERFVAQRDALTEAAEQTLFRLLDEHGRAGKVLVLGDTALLGLCDALDLPRRLYDETLSGSRGFWVLLVPGVIHRRQPLFNEGAPMWHLEGATLPLLNPINLSEGHATASAVPKHEAITPPNDHGSSTR
jgi:serine/threonine protein kinase